MVQVKFQVFKVAISHKDFFVNSSSYNLISNVKTFPLLIYTKNENETETRVGAVAKNVCIYFHSVQLTKRNLYYIQRFLTFKIEYYVLV